MVRIPTNREPTHPGEMLLEEFLTPMQITQRDLAKKINVSYQRINELVNKRRGVTPSLALRLSKVFGMSADFWLNLQIRWDLYKAQIEEKVKIMETTKSNLTNQEDGEKELALIINKAGDEARTRRKKALDAHFDKLNQEIKQAVYLNNNRPIPK